MIGIPNALLRKVASPRSRLFVGACIVLCFLWTWVRVFRPPIVEGISFSKVVTDRKGEILRVTLAEDQAFRLWTSLESVSPLYVEATLLKEDRFFYWHIGVNPFALVRAFFSTYITRDRVEGASTITMQVARMRWGLHTRSLPGKLEQIGMAFYLELFHSKKEILEAYLNLAPFGGNVEGIESASRLYFHKSSRELSLSESLVLVLIPQDPNDRRLRHDQLLRSANQEVNSVDPDSMTREHQAARTDLIKKWFKKFPADQKFETDLSLPIHFFSARQLPFEAPHAVDLILSQSKTLLGISGHQEQLRPNATTQTTLDLRFQKLIEKISRKYVHSHESFGVRNASVVLIDNNHREIRAMIGSINYFDKSIQGQVNGAIAARSPGSTLKPFLYALAADQGLIHSETLLKDTPRSFGNFDPENFDREFKGPLSATEALIYSRNLPAVALAVKTKAPSLYGFLQSAGVRLPRDEQYYGLAIALGAAEIPLLKMGELYSGLARGGDFKPLKSLTGGELSQNSNRYSETDSSPLISPDAAFLINHMLTQNPRALQNWNGGRRSSIQTRDEMEISWKTGTSFGFRDAWTLGSFGPWTLGVWLGNFDNTSNPVFIGRDLAAPLFFELAEALRGFDEIKTPTSITTPSDIRKIEVCALSGAIATPHCHHRKNAWFIAAKSPIERCDIHREVLISKRSGKRLCDPLAPDAKREIFEFWPSDILKLYRQAGIPRRQPPAFDSSCPISNLADLGTPPLISSPKEGVEYTVRASDDNYNDLTFQAVTDGDARKIFWFVNNEFIGTSTAGQDSLTWRARAGDFTVRAVDELGRSDSRELRVSTVK